MEKEIDEKKREEIVEKCRSIFNELSYTDFLEIMLQERILNELDIVFCPWFHEDLARKLLDYSQYDIDTREYPEYAKMDIGVVKIRGPREFDPGFSYLNDYIKADNEKVNEMISVFKSLPKSEQLDSFLRMLDIAKTSNIESKVMQFVKNAET